MELLVYIGGKPKQDSRLIVARFCRQCCVVRKALLTS